MTSRLGMTESDLTLSYKTFSQQRRLAGGAGAEERPLAASWRGEAARMVAITAISKCKFY